MTADALADLAGLVLSAMVLATVVVLLWALCLDHVMTRRDEREAPLAAATWTLDAGARPIPRTDTDMACDAVDWEAMP